MSRRSVNADREPKALDPGKPVNLRVGRTTVITLPSGEEVLLEPELEKGHVLLRITAPEGARIDHRKGGTRDNCSGETDPQLLRKKAAVGDPLRHAANAAFG